MAAQLFKDPYLFDFLGAADPRREREVERGLIDHVERFLLELGRGFAFVGRQKTLEVGDGDFIIDLLFYHYILRCFVVVELKAVPFEPAFVGQLNLYLSAVDDLLRQPGDKPTIGLMLCRARIVSWRNTPCATSANRSAWPIGNRNSFHRCPKN